MAWPLRHLVQKGLCDTDCTRSGYWTSQGDEMACDAFNLVHVALAEEVLDNDPPGTCSEPHPGAENELREEWEGEIDKAMNKPHGEMGVLNPLNQMNSYIRPAGKPKRKRMRTTQKGKKSVALPILTPEPTSPRTQADGFAPLSADAQCHPDS